MKIARGGAARRRQPRTRPGSVFVAGARTLRVLKHRHRDVRLVRTPVALECGKAVTRLLRVSSGFVSAFPINNPVRRKR